MFSFGCATNIPTIGNKLTINYFALLIPEHNCLTNGQPIISEIRSAIFSLYVWGELENA